MRNEHALWIGLDWADRKHDLMVAGSPTELPVHHVVDSKPEVLRQWIMDRRAEHRDGRFAVCLEQKRGAVINLLATYDFIDLFPVNPLQMDHYRRAFHCSGAKSDSADAGLLLERILRHPQECQILEPDTPQMRALAKLCEMRRSTVDDRTRVCNRIKSLLKQYFPQALDLCGEKLYAPLAVDFLTRWSSFPAFSKATPRQITAFYAKHRTGAKTLEAALDRRRSSCPLTTDPAVVEPARLQLQALLEQIVCLHNAALRFQQRIEEIQPEIEEVALFASFPGAGKAMAPRLAAAFGSDRSRWTSAANLQCYFGVAPVTSASGTKRWVHWRWSCPKFLRQTLVEYAWQSVKQSKWARKFYNEQRARGKTHQHVLRLLAYKWVRIMFRCWKERVPYDEEHHLETLRAKGRWPAKDA